MWHGCDLLSALGISAIKPARPARLPSMLSKFVVNRLFVLQAGPSEGNPDSADKKSANIQSLLGLSATVLMDSVRGLWLLSVK
jgi:hypothetical protein